MTNKQSPEDQVTVLSAGLLQFSIEVAKREGMSVDVIVAALARTTIEIIKAKVDHNVRDRKVVEARKLIDYSKALADGLSQRIAELRSTSLII